MADSIREQILQELVTMLEEVAGIGNVKRGKIDPASIQRYPAAFIVPGADVPTQLLNDTLDRNWQMFLFLWTNADPGLSEAMELFAADVKKKMVEDHSLNGLALDVIEGASSELFPMNEEQTEAAMTIEYEIKYRTQRTDPYTGV